MTRISLLSSSLALALLPAAAFAAQTKPSDFSDNWPTHVVLEDGTDLGIAFKYQYDVNRFSHDDGRFDDAQTSRRKELGIYAKKKNVYDATAVFDFQAKTWLDVFARVQTQALLGRDAGAVRAGYSKTPVGFEGNTGTGSTTFMETALPTQALYAGRRIGVDWALVRPAWLVNAGYYWGGDLQGDSDGHMTAARVAWTPRHASGDVLHLGLSASRETPDGSTDGRGAYHAPGARLRARPEAGLTSIRLVDSGSLSLVDRIDREGVEALWIGGPWSLQGEYLQARVSLANGRPSYRGEGWYALGSWVVTGESRGYKAGNVGDVSPKGAWGALELAVRYSELDLDDAPVLGGTERNWTVGANWYLSRYLKLQANYVHARSERRGLAVDPNVVEVRAQIAF
ncbi:OprO/OprP family phosphate-selective porin [Dyella sp.]|jgi:phosphate-selective porin OprO/OprP|uniref:OprO/OprP family phosphate-selective porin n=1 Tax=Dyella sp. TaxID=1869338 RepID=UPI002D78A5AD|nr:OprO/OprP family phosphate-selective porin [Dyella sp.]HET6432815.1 OprO/OprP family phosphate-selective porin [Dyella sp.]